MTPNSKQLFRAGVIIGVGAIAFLRGNHLLGYGHGAMFSLGAVLSCILINECIQNSHQKRIRRFAARFITMVLTGIVVVGLINPVWINSDNRFLMERHQLYRETKSQLHLYLKSRPEFDQLSFNCGKAKSVYTKIYGTVPSDKTFQEFRTGLFEECPHIRPGNSLSWNIQILETNNNYEGDDGWLFEQKDLEGSKEGSGTKI